MRRSTSRTAARLHAPIAAALAAASLALALAGPAAAQPSSLREMVTRVNLPGGQGTQTVRILPVIFSGVYLGSSAFGIGYPGFFPPTFRYVLTYNYGRAPVYWSWPLEYTELGGDAWRPGSWGPGVRVGWGDESTQTSDPTPAPPLTLLEAARLTLHEGNQDEAVALYRQHLQDQPDDLEASRELGVALIETGLVTEGAALVRLVYDRDPMLASTPMTGLIEPATRLRRVLRRSVQYANKIESATAWLTVAVLMQAEGRDDRALKVLELAEDRGLPHETAEPLRLALRSASP